MLRRCHNIHAISELGASCCCEASRVTEEWDILAQLFVSLIQISTRTTGICKYFAKKVRHVISLK